MAVSKPNIVWPEGFGEQAIFDLPYKGWFSVYVKSDVGCRYEIHFSDPVRLRQDLETEVQLGKPYLAMPNLIVLPKVTVPAIEEAIQRLWIEGFFAYIKAE